MYKLWLRKWQVCVILLEALLIRPNIGPISEDFYSAWFQLSAAGGKYGWKETTVARRVL